MNETRCKVKVFLRYLAFEKFNVTIVQSQLHFNTAEAARETVSTYRQHSGHFKNKQLVLGKYLWVKQLSKISFEREKKWRKSPRLKCCVNHSRCFVWTKRRKTVRWRKISQKFERVAIQTYYDEPSKALATKSNFYISFLEHQQNVTCYSLFKCLN